MLLWLWCRPAAAATNQFLAWEPPYAMGEALKKTERKKEREGERTRGRKGERKKKERRKEI